MKQKIIGAVAAIAFGALADWLSIVFGIQNDVAALYIAIVVIILTGVSIILLIGALKRP